MQKGPTKQNKFKMIEESVFEDKQMWWGLREGGNDGRREKGLRALRGTEGREKQEDDKIGKRGRKRQQLSQIADISLGYIIYNAPLSAQWWMCINPLPRENQLISVALAFHHPMKYLSTNI